MVYKNCGGCIADRDETDDLFRSANQLNMTIDASANTRSDIIFFY